VINAVKIAEVCHQFGDKFTIVSDENVEDVFRLDCNGLVPYLKCRTRVGLSSKGYTPHVAGEIINYV
jgi:hypothetical protein